MFRRRKRHSVPGLDTTSTADISFMLLIFFLVTTSMDSMKGLGRQLPPIDPDEQEELQDVDKSKIMTIHLLANPSSPNGSGASGTTGSGQALLTINDKPAKIDDSLRKTVRHFIIEKGKGHIISLIVDRDADYDSYFHLQNQLVRAYTEIRNAASEKKYGKPFASLDEEQHDEIAAFYPQRIQETSN